MVFKVFFEDLEDVNPLFVVNIIVVLLYFLTASIDADDPVDDEVREREREMLMLFVNFPKYTIIMNSPTSQEAGVFISLFHFQYSIHVP